MMKCLDCGSQVEPDAPCESCEETAKIVITECKQPGVTACRDWFCQRANECAYGEN